MIRDSKKYAETWMGMGKMAGCGPKAVWKDSNSPANAPDAQALANTNYVFTMPIRVNSEASHEKNLPLGVFSW